MESQRSLRWITGAIVLVLLASAVAVGRVSAPGSARPVVPGPTRTVRGVTLGFAHTLPGAEAAAAHYLLELERAMDTLDPRWTSTVGALVATPTEAQAIATHATDVIALERASGAPARRVAIATDSVAYSAHAAQVTVLEAWLYANSEQEAAWAIERVSLVWQHGDWRVDTIEGAAPSSRAGDASVR